MSISQSVPEVQDVAAPPSGRWVVDPGHAEVGFSGRHLMLTKVRGRFTGVDATIEIADRLEESTVAATIEMASVTSGDAARDDHLRSADFFDVDRWPIASFRSTGIAVDGPTAVLSGDLTVKGLTHALDIDVRYLGHVVDPWGAERVVFDGVAKVDRENWGLTWNMLLDSGGLLVSKEIELELQLEFVRPASLST